MSRLPIIRHKSTDIKENCKKENNVTLVQNILMEGVWWLMLQEFLLSKGLFFLSFPFFPSLPPSSFSSLSLPSPQHYDNH